MRNSSDSSSDKRHPNARKLMWQLPELRGISGGFHSAPLPPGDDGRSPQRLRNPPPGDRLPGFVSRLGPFHVARQLRSVLPGLMEMLPSMTNCLLGRESHKCHGVNTCGSNNDSTLDMTAAIPFQRLLLLCVKASVFQGGLGGGLL